MQDFDNDNYNRNPYAKNVNENDSKQSETKNDAPFSGEQTTDNSEVKNNGSSTENAKNTEYNENYQKAQETQNSNPFDDYYVHKSNGFIPPENPFTSGSSNSSGSWSASGNGGYSDSGASGNPYDKKNGAFQSGANIPAQKGGKGLAIASMVLGIVSLVCCCCGGFISLILAITGLILGIISQSRGSSGYAIAGIITSAFGIVFGIIGVVIAVSGIFDDIDSIIKDPNFPFGSGDDYPPFLPDDNNQANLSDIMFSIKLFLGL